MRFHPILLLTTCLAVGCGSPRGVLLAIKLDEAIPASVIEEIRTLEIIATGDENASRDYPIAAPFHMSGERVLYRPAAEKPVGIVFVIRAKDSAGQWLAHGETGPLQLGLETIERTVTLLRTPELQAFIGIPDGPKEIRDGPYAEARFQDPSGIAAVGDDLYIVEATPHVIRRAKLGLVTTFAGTAGTAGTLDGVGTGAQFNRPVDVLSDGTSLYVSDHGNRTIRRVSIATGGVTTLAGTPGAVGAVDGPSLSARFTGTFGIALQGNMLYVCDGLAHTIRRIDLAAGMVTTLAGQAGTKGSSDGVGDVARFNIPAAIAVPGDGFAYISDGFNKTIRRLDLASREVTTILGQAGENGDLDGTGSLARFGLVGTLVAGADATLLMTEDAGATVRKIWLGNPAMVTIAGTHQSDRRVRPGRLPGTFGEVGGLARLSGGDLILSTHNAILRVPGRYP